MALTKVKIKLKSKGNPAPSAYSAASSPDMGKCIEAARLTALLAEKVDNSTFFEFRDLFDSLFEKVTKNGVTSIRAKHGLWTDEFLSARGKNEAGGGTGGLDIAKLEDYLTGNKYATQPWVTSALGNYYPSRPTTANVNFGNNAGLYTFLATSSMTSGKPAGDGHILHMEWDNSLSWAGQIAVPNNGDMQWRHQRGNTWQAWRTILDSSNFNSLIGSGLTAYVRKAGDTMTGMLNIKMDTQPCLKLDSVTANKEVYMYVYSGGVAKNAVGWNNVHGSYIYNSPSNRYLGIKDNGTPHFQGNTIWHAGNDGSRSGLDADLLDGYHKSDIYDNVTAKLSSLNDVLNSNGIRIYGFGYGDSASVANKPAENSDARGTIGFGGIYCPMQLSWQYLGTDLYIRTKYSGNWQGWKRIAFTTDNVVSATKWQTARRFWGQLADGTADVNGAMTINYTGETGILLKRVEAGSGAFIRLYNNNQTTNYFRIGMYGAGYFGISYNSGAGAIAVTTSGNVGIGTISPSRKLHVNGDIQTVSIYASNWFRSTGATGWYSETYGGGWYMNDTTWIRNFGNKGLYMGTAIIRTDNYFDREGYSGASWFNGYGAYNTAIVNNSGQTPLMVAYRSGQTPAVTGANRLFSLELLNTGTELRFSFGGFGNGGGCPVLMTSYGELRVGRSIQSTAWFSDSGQIRAHAVGTNYYLGMGAATDGYGVIQSSKVGTGAIPLLLNPKGGNVGINTSAPGYTLDVNGSLHVRTLVYFDSTARINGDIWTNGQFFLNASGYDQQPYMSGAFGKFNLAFHRNGVWVDTVMTIMPDGAASMTGPLHVNKGIYTEGYVSARGQNTSSDARLKDVTGNVELDIRAIARAPAVFFRWKDTGGEDVGSIAQYWQALMPQLTPRKPSGMLDLQYDKAALLGVVTVSRKVLDHEERIAALEAENASLKATIENMRGNA